MARQAEPKKIRSWARDGDRTDPETVGIDREDGWGPVYEQVGGSQPERTVFNQVLHEICELVLAKMTAGILSWDARVNYRHPAFTDHMGTLYVSTQNSGPATGRTEAPSSGVSWKPY